VKDYDGQTAFLNNDTEIPTSTVIWSAGVKGQLIEGIKKESIAGGRYKVDVYNRIEGYENIFSIGDVATMSTEENPRGHVMVAPVAVQQASNLAKNFRNKLNGKALKPFKYNDRGAMATVGRNKAVVDLPSGSFGGFFAWLVWMFLHLMLLVGFRNRVVVFVDWMWNYFSYERALRLIVRAFDAEEAAKGKGAVKSVFD
jgi:NADH dehydrogenase